MSLIFAINLATPVGYKVPKFVQEITPYSTEATDETGYEDETDYVLDNQNEENPGSADADNQDN
ncbi:MAG: hypothetical protein NC213_01275 [Acetobacter sp.]|nr:hypothetical protein [Bacteroides sp.]MCM1340358.1 hypothetical protein [Acetobacter sp.]MCM1432995.1 hypothetical protein [Clostridiales bacterium]